MAIGLARMFGFRFPENFDYPYTARSIQDFWRRWHISLSTWFRDYVYLPLGGNRGGTLRTLRNLWIVFLLTGIWHGASWNFVIWGALHGAFLTIERLLARSPLAALPVPALLRHAYALAVVMLAWVFFRADTLGEATAFLRALAGLGAQDEHSIDLNGHESALLVLAIALALGLFPWLRERLAPLRTASARIGVDGWLRAATLGVVLVACLMSLAVGQYNPFIYFRF
jgi:alginate O-acetyltransferase complex protein AlgI